MSTMREALVLREPGCPCPAHSGQLGALSSPGGAPHLSQDRPAGETSLSPHLPANTPSPHHKAQVEPPSPHPRAGGQRSGGARPGNKSARCVPDACTGTRAEAEWRAQKGHPRAVDSRLGHDDCCSPGASLCNLSCSSQFAKWRNTTAHVGR